MSAVHLLQSYHLPSGVDKPFFFRFGVLTIYMQNPEIPVGKSNGTHHSIWSTSEVMGFWSK